MLVVQVFQARIKTNIKCNRFCFIWFCFYVRLQFNRYRFSFTAATYAWTWVLSANWIAGTKVKLLRVSKRRNGECCCKWQHANVKTGENYSHGVLALGQVGSWLMMTDPNVLCTVSFFIAFDSSLFNVPSLFFTFEYLEKKKFWFRNHHPLRNLLQLRE